MTVIGIRAERVVVGAGEQELNPIQRTKVVQ